MELLIAIIFLVICQLIYFDLFGCKIDGWIKFDKAADLIEIHLTEDPEKMKKKHTVRLKVIKTGSNKNTHNH